MENKISFIKNDSAMQVFSSLPMFSNDSQKTNPTEQILCGVIFFNRGGRNRTLLWSFGDSYSTDELHPYMKLPVRTLLFYNTIFVFLCQYVFNIYSTHDRCNGFAKTCQLRYHLINRPMLITNQRRKI